MGYMKRGNLTGRFAYWVLTVCMVAAVTGCHNYDDSEIVGLLDGQEARLNSLERLCLRMNSNIISMLAYGYIASE